jgi:Putative S-adenosyl-L-methionine-dependent methyltransferase
VHRTNGRDQDSLYNPHYGYFSKHAVIFSSDEPFDFNKIKNESQFVRQLSQKYTEFEDALDYKEPNEARQLWHTPTELFKPYYSEAITRYLVDNYMLSHHPYHDLIVYEMGAGNGTMVLNMLDHIRDIYPEVYERTQVRIIEISSSLAAMQTSRLMRSAGARGHQSHVEVINRSIFDWDTYVPDPCYFLALEVFDNFAHDAISYDLETAEARQQAVLVDAEGEFYPYLLQDPDPIASRFLRVRDVACDRPFKHPLRLTLKKRLQYSLPFASPTSEPEYIPTRLMQFFDILHRYFPLHRLVSSDFHHLPDSVAGINAPVVQTRFQRQTIPVTTPLVGMSACFNQLTHVGQVHQGYFDILFPSDFPVAEDMYRAITGKLTRVMRQEDFLKNWAYLEDTRTMDGGNPMLSWYKNASMMLTV